MYSLLRGRCGNCVLRGCSATAILSEHCTTNSCDITTVRPYGAACRRLFTSPLARTALLSTNRAERTKVSGQKIWFLKRNGYDNTEKLRHCFACKHCMHCTSATRNPIYRLHSWNIRITPKDSLHAIDTDSKIQNQRSQFFLTSFCVVS